MMVKKKLASLIWLALATATAGCDSADTQDPDLLGSTDTSDTTDTTDITDLATAAAVENKQHHDEAADYLYGSSTAIVFNSSSVSVTGSGAAALGAQVTISEPGVYRLSGATTDGGVLVNSGADGTVWLLLDNVDINHSSSAAINVAQADKTVVVVLDGTDNRLTDATSYVYPDAETDEPNAAVFSSDDLSIIGAGNLLVTGQYADGITSKDGLVLNAENLTVIAQDDGIDGKDYLVLLGGAVDVTAGGDGLRSNNDSDAAKGYVSVEGGTLHVAAQADGIQAASDILVSGGATLDITTAGGHTQVISAEDSAKALKAGVVIEVSSGTLLLDSPDDAMHSGYIIEVNGGNFNIETGDDGLHADTQLTVNAGSIVVTESYEGLEATIINVNGGSVNVVSSDDGINVAGGNDGSGGGQGPGFGGGGARAAAVTAEGNLLNITGGHIVVDAQGDGLDANGSITMSGGTVLVNGPTGGGNGALDYDGSFVISGGVLVAVGSAGMAQALSASSSQNSLKLGLSGTQTAGTVINSRDAESNSLLSFAPSKSFASFVYSAPSLTAGTAYTVSVGGSMSGDIEDGLLSSGSYSGGSDFATFMATQGVSNVQ